MGMQWCALGVHRATLFDALYDSACAASIEIIASTRIASGDARLRSFDLVVDALGKNSPLAIGIARRTELPYGALWMNVPWPATSNFPHDALEQRYRRATHMAGVLPIGRRAPDERLAAAFFWSLKRSDVQAWRERGIGQWQEAVTGLWPEAGALLEDCTPDKVTFAEYDHYTARQPYSERLVHIGDSARATSPQLGQGANMALLDALALAHALELHDDLRDALPAYAKMRRWHIRLFQWASATFTPFYQSDSRVLPLIRDWLTAPLSRLPIGSTVLARLVSGMTVPPLRGVKFSPRTKQDESWNSPGADA